MKNPGISYRIRSNLIIFLVLIAAVIICYVNALPNGFVSDDITGLVENVKEGNMVARLISPLHPLRLLLYAVIAQIFGLNATWFRVPNIVFHAGSVIFLFLLLEKMQNRSVAFFSALLFAVHPMIVESVTWISAGMQPQSAFFFFLALFLYITHRKAMDALAFVAYLLAVLSNEKSVVLFPVFILWEYLFGDRKNILKRGKPFLVFGTVTLLIAFGYISYRLRYLTNLFYLDKGMYNPLLQIPVAITSYIRLYVFPDTLSFYQSELTYSTVEFAIRYIVFALVVAGTIVAWFRNKFVFFMLTVAILSLSPTMTPFRIAWVFAERYAYIAVGCVSAIVGFYLSRLWKQPKLTAIIYIGYAIVICLLTYRTVIRNMDWKNEDTLWIATSKTAPSDPKTHNNLGDMYARHGEMEKSKIEFEKAILLSPGYADAYHNLANTLIRMGKFTEAEDLYRKAIAINPNLWQSRRSLVVLLINKGNFIEATGEIDKALDVMKTNAELYALAALIALHTDKPDLAKQYEKQATKLDPNNSYAETVRLEMKKYSL